MVDPGPSRLGVVAGALKKSGWVLVRYDAEKRRAHVDSPKSRGTIGKSPQTDSKRPSTPPKIFVLARHPASGANLRRSVRCVDRKLHEPGGVPFAHRVLSHSCDRRHDRPKSAIAETTPKSVESLLSMH
jgi:hypothetical protein